MDRARTYLRQCKVRPGNSIGYLGLSIEKLGKIYTDSHPEARDNDVLWFFQNGANRRVKNSTKDESMISLKSLIDEAIDMAKKEADTAAAATSSLAASEPEACNEVPIEFFTT